MYGALNVSVSGMVAQRTRENVIAANIANADSLLNANGEHDPYRRRFALLAPGGPDGESLGVRVAEIAVDDGPLRKVYDPTHPLAATETDPARDLVEGYVNHPNVDTTIETIDSIEARRAYEANVSAAEAAKSMMAQAMQLIA